MLDEIIKENTDYIVCDDIPWEKFPVPKAIIGCQNSFILTDKYRKKIKIDNWDKPCIILSNPDMDYRNHMDYSFLTWFNDNCLTIPIQDPLF